MPTEATTERLLFHTHEATLRQAVAAIRTRGYWSPFAEMPSPKIYGETANDAGKAAFEARLHHAFALDQPGTVGETGAEVSPYGMPLGIRYPKVNLDVLLHAVNRAAGAWRAAGPEAWAGVALEILSRLNRRSFEMAYAVMHTTGQAFMMAFQAGGPHAQDRGLEAVAYAWAELERIPRTALWEKPQGKNPPLRMEKRYSLVPRGTGLVIGCCTFPTWNAYPGLFADLATGNAVVVKPHPGAILPLALTVETARAVLRENGFDPNVVTLVAHEAGDDTARELALRPEIKIIDFTGSPEHGAWLEHNARQAVVFTEKAGVNPVVVDSSDDLAGVARNLAFSLALYSGQMCTAPQNIYVTRSMMAQVSDGLTQALGKLLGEPARAVEILGAIQNDAILERLERVRAQAGGDGIVLDRQILTHPQFPEARIRTPLLLRAQAGEPGRFQQEVFGPVAFLIATESTEESLELAARGAREHGALTFSVYSTNPEVLARARTLAGEAGVALSENLTGGVFVNQSAAFSDYHGTGANPAANAALTDSAFVASRFRVAQSRAPLA